MSNVRHSPIWRGILYIQTEGVVGKMSKKRKLIIMLACAVLVVAAISTFFPLVDVNVIFVHPLDNNELATVFQDTSFWTIQHVSVVDWGRGGGSRAFAGNSQLFGTPLDGAAIEEALAAEPRGTGFAVLAGQVSFIDFVRIENSPFVYDVAVYFPYLRFWDFGERQVTPNSQRRFYENVNNP